VYSYILPPAIKRCGALTWWCAHAAEPPHRWPAPAHTAEPPHRRTLIPPYACLPPVADSSVPPNPDGYGALALLTSWGIKASPRSAYTGE
jgi:hypothetical protein